MLKLTEYFLNHPRVTHMFVVILFLAGIGMMVRLNRQAMPPVSFDVLTISTAYPGASPEDVEINVTSKLEERLKEVENLKSLTSLSMENLSMIHVIVDSDAGDPEETKRKVREAVDRTADLPEGVHGKPAIDEIKATNFPVMEISLSGEVPELVLRKYAKDLEDRLKEIPGTGRVDKIGYREREVHVEADLNKIRNARIPLSLIINSIRSRSVRITGGTLQSFASEKKIVTMSEFRDPMDVKDVIVRSNFGANRIRLSDIADIKNDFNDPRILFRGNGRPAILLKTMLQDNADIIQLSNAMKGVVEEFRVGLPENVRVEIMFDYSIYTRLMLSMVQMNGLMGIALVFLVMIAFLDARSAIWSSFGIPFSVLGALILFPVFGLNLNNVTLATMILLIGIVVDDAIVVTEKVFSLKQRGVSNRDAVLEGVGSMILPVSAAILTTILAFVPIFFISGVFGKFLYSIPIVVILILGLSWIESMLFLPTHIHHAPHPGEKSRRTAWILPLINSYTNLLRTLLPRRWLLLGGYLLAFLVIVSISVKFMRFMLDENINPDLFAVVIETPQGSSLQHTKDRVVPIEKIVAKTVPANVLQSYTTQVGHHDTSMMGAVPGEYSNWAMIFVYLVPAEKRDITSEKLMVLLKEKLQGLKDSGNYQRLDVQQLGGGLDVGKAVAISYISNNNEVRDRLEKETLAFLKDIKGVTNVETTNLPGKDQMELKLHFGTLADLGLSALDVADTVRAAFDGSVATTIRLEGEEISFRVRLKNREHFTPEDVLRIPIADRMGNLIPLSAIAHFERSVGPAVIHHDSGKRSVHITANVDETIITPVEVNNMIRKEFTPVVSSIPGVRMKFGGQEEEMAKSFEDFRFALIVVLISIYFLLVVLFNSYSQPFLIMSIIPFAIGGVFLTLILHGRPLTFISLIGMLGLIGVAVNDTIVMITHLNHVTERLGYTLEAIATGASERFRPVILTTMTTFAGLLPTSYGLGGDLPDLRPMVLTMAWGILFSTVITLGFIPALYSVFRIPPEFGFFRKKPNS